MFVFDNCESTIKRDYSTFQMVDISCDQDSTDDLLL